MKLIGLSGSLRQDSFNSAILRTVSEALAPKVDLQIFPLNAIPPYDGDEDLDASPSAVADLREALDAATGLLIATPEYNHGISGVLKNALDWASRPYGRSALIGKPVLTLSSSVAITGGVRAHAQLNETLASITARVVLRPQIAIGEAHLKVRGGRLVDASTLDFILDGIRHLLRDIEERASGAVEQA